MVKAAPGQGRRRARRVRCLPCADGSRQPTADKPSPALAVRCARGSSRASRRLMPSRR